MADGNVHDGRKPYVSPRLIEHGTVESLTETGVVFMHVEKHPLLWQKGSKIRPKPR